MTEHEEEYEGITLNVSANGWPENLTGIVIKEQIVYVKDGTVSIIADPVWAVESPEES